MSMPCRTCMRVCERRSSSFINIRREYSSVSLVCRCDRFFGVFDDGVGFAFGAYKQLFGFFVGFLDDSLGFFF